MKTSDEIAVFSALATLLLALFTGVLAAFTAAMAWSTRKMAKKTADIADQEDRHHIDNLMPVCEFHFPPNKPRPVLEWDEDPESHPPSFFEIRIPGNESQRAVTIQNIGLGPALHLKVILCLRKFPGPSFFAFADDLRPGTACQAPRIFGPRLEDISNSSWVEYIQSPDEDYEIFLEYTDVFNKPYHTQLNWAPGNPANTFYRGERAPDRSL